MKAPGFYAGVFLVAAVGLTQQLVQTRILSVLLWYHLAFFVISLAMFGLAAGAIWVHLRGARYDPSLLGLSLQNTSLQLALITAATLALELALPEPPAHAALAALFWVGLCALVALPFFFAGIVLCLALTRSPFPVGRVYGVDLLGAAAGAGGTLLLLETTDGATAVLATAAAAALASLCFADPATSRTRPALATVGLLLLTLINGLSPPDRRPLTVSTRPDGEPVLFEAWNSFSRVLAQTARGRALFGPSPLAPPTDAAMRLLTIDGLAGTPMYRFSGDERELEFLDYDVTNLAYALEDRQRVAVVGVGGGRDVLAARLRGAREITAIDLNPIFIDLLTEHPEFSAFAGLGRLQDIEWIVDEARSWFARTHRVFDLIQMSMIDTWAATGAGAFTLSENGLYTMEAWRILLDRLSSRGVLSVSRWYAPGEINETGRLVSLAIGTLIRRGVALPRRHLFLASSRSVATLVLSSSPLADDDVERLEERARRLEFTVLASPSTPPASETLAGIVEAEDLRALSAITRRAALDLRPPTDDRPFFFNQLPLDRPSRLLALSNAPRYPGVVSGNLQAARNLLLILLITLGLAAATIAIPWRSLRATATRTPIAAATAYFALIGTGFMAVEIALLQRMSVFLGHPIYSLAIVLSAIVLTTGGGSFASHRWPLDRPRRLVGWCAATAAYLAILPLVWGDPLLASEGLPLPARAAVCFAAILPAGLLMGYGFPTGMRLAAPAGSRMTAWLWGVNGAAAVFTGALALVISMTAGIRATLLMGAGCYLVLVLPALRLAARSTDGALPDSSAAVESGGAAPE